ncbi:8181_t:CDS:2, partial [Funneliformis geosporum]
SKIVTMSTESTENNSRDSSYEWSFKHFVSLFENFNQTENNNGLVYNILYVIRDDSSASKEVHKTVKALLSRKNWKGVESKLTDITNSVRRKVERRPLSKKNKNKSASNRNTYSTTSNVNSGGVDENSNDQSGPQQKFVSSTVYPYPQISVPPMHPSPYHNSLPLSATFEEEFTSSQENNKNDRKVIQKLNNIENLVKELQKIRGSYISVAFQWDDRPEREQKDRYIPHLRKIPNIGNLELDRFSISSRIPQHHIRILFELKKSINDEHFYQALAELTAGD